MNELDFNHFRVVAKYETENKLVFHLESNSLPLTCPNCKFSDKLYKHGSRLIKCADLPPGAKQVELYISHKRFKCLNCYKTFSVDLSHTIDEKHRCTKRLKSDIELKCIDKTFVEVANEVGLNEKTIRNIFSDFLEQLSEVTHIAPPEWLGLYEVHIIHPRCAVTDVTNNKLIDLLPDCNKDTIINFIDNLPDFKKSIKYVSMDIQESTKEAINSVLPQTKIYVDRVSVLEIAGDIYDSEQLNLFDMEKYEYKESFHNIFNNMEVNNARNQYLIWQSNIPESLSQEFASLVQTINTWDQEIFSPFDFQQLKEHRRMLKQLNWIIKDLERGYSFDAQKAAILLRFNKLQ